MDDPIPRPVRDAGGLLLEALLGVAGEREDVRRALTTVNAWLARELGRRAEEARRPGSEGRGDIRGEVRGDVREHGRAEPRGEGPLVPRATAPAEEARPVDLARVRARASWKGEALRLALAKRAAGPAPGPELRAREAELRARHHAAGSPWPWMLDAPAGRASDADLARLARSYEVAARVAEGLERLERAEALEPAPPVDLLRLVAETQSGLLVALGAVGLRQDDDQRDLFQWLRERTTRHRIYVDRHMRLEDPADPGRADDLAQRFDAALERALALCVGRKQRVQLLNKVRYHVRRLIDGGTALPSEWAALAAALGRWCESGLDLADRGLVEVLGALTRMDLPGEGPEAVADGAPHGAARATLLEALALARGAEGGRTDAVAEARPLLEGKRALMVAEPADDDAVRALEATLGLARVEWLAMTLEEGPPGDSPGAAETLGRARVERITAALEAHRPDLVYMGLRLPQDEYQAFKERCVERNLPFVRLPGTPTPGSVAHQTLRQVGWRLRDRSETATS